jgi:hypothetical protein
VSGAFLMAEVPYGGNGFTLLLSAISKQRRMLAEVAQNAVPRSGSGADGTNIFVCRDVSQGDTGRQGSARLVLANVDLEQLDEQRLERLQWKLERFLDSLEALLPDVPQATGRDCGPVVSARLKEWEEELKVSQLPAVQALRAATDAAVPTKPHGIGKYAALVIAGLCLLGYWTGQRGGKPEGVAEDRDDTAEGVTAEPETPDRLHSGSSQRTTELSSRGDLKPDTPSKKRKKLLPELLGEWRRQTLTVKEAIERLDAAWGTRNDAERQSVSGQEIAVWLGSLWWPDQAVDAGSDLGAEWQAAALQLVRLGEVANLQNFSGARGIASEIPAVRARFHQDVIRALQMARESQLIRHSAQIFQYGTPKGKALGDMIRLDVAVKTRLQESGLNQSVGKSWQQVKTPPALSDAFTALMNIGDENSPALLKSVAEFQLLLQALNEVLGAELSLTIDTKNNSRTIESVRQSFDVMELLHVETLEIQGKDRQYTLGGEKRARGTSAREYWRRLLTVGDGTEVIPSRVNVSNFLKENLDPVNEIALELRRADGSNNAWFSSRDEFRKHLDSFDALLQQAKATVPGDVTGELRQ